jgi:hypothetical protein
MKQVHGDQIIDVKDVNVKEAGEGDGMKTGEKEAFLGILTADCVPILLLAPDKNVVAAVHAVRDDGGGADHRGRPGHRRADDTAPSNSSRS